MTAQALTRFLTFSPLDCIFPDYSRRESGIQSPGHRILRETIVEKAQHRGLEWRVAPKGRLAGERRHRTDARFPGDGTGVRHQQWRGAAGVQAALIFPVAESDQGE